VHHDVWDYDVPAQPVLYEHHTSSGSIPAVISATKRGTIFLLNRLTGQPLFPVEERPVPATDVPGEQSSPTQPVPTKPGPLTALSLKRSDIWGLTPWDKAACLKIFDGLDNKGPFTPPSLRGSLVFPGLGGGINWGSVSVDPTRRRMVVNLQTLPFIVKLVPREQAKALGPITDIDSTGAQEGTPYMAARSAFVSPSMKPCTAPPWGRIMAIDLDTGAVKWSRILGNLNDRAPFGIGRLLPWGTPNVGGSLQTGSGLIFIGATMDRYVRAFDSDNGEELWRYELPFTAQATPMTYRGSDGHQLVVIAAGGHGVLGTQPGDALVAFHLEH